MINKEINSGKISKQKIISGLKNFKTNNSRGLKRNYWYPLMSPTYDEKEIMQALHSMITFNTTMFDKTKKFEKKFSIFNKSKYSVMVNSGSSADLLISFTLVDKLLKILKKGDEIIIPVLTWPTHIWSAIMAGLKVKLIDINPDNLNIDIDILKKKITKKTKAIFLVHALGNPCPMKEILNVARKNKLLILEDCCEALGAKYNKINVGNFGLAASFSFFFAHHINTMEGGLITTNSSKIMRNLKVIRAHGWRRSIVKNLKNSGNNFYKKFEFLNWGFNVRPTELQAGFGIEQLKKINRFNKNRKVFFKRFYNAFKNNRYFYFPKVEKESEPSWFAIPIILKKDCPFKRNALIKYLDRHGVETRPIIVGNLANHPVSKLFPELNMNIFHGANYIHNNGFYIGLNPMANLKIIDNLIDKFQNFFDNF
jgi:CDP-6-deoxy-D-xylo-4-hexulose-3-dehydrase